MRASFAAATAALLLSPACFAKVLGSGHLKTETRDVPEFDAVAVTAGIRATISIGPRKPIRIEADDDLLRIVETTVRDGVLTIGFESNESIESRNEIRVTIQTPELHGVMASGGAYVRAQLTRGEEAELDASGGGEVHVRGVDAHELRVAGSGGGVVEMQGRADRARMEMSGGTHVLASELSVGDLHVTGTGGSEAEVRVSGKIRGRLSGGSELHVRGNASSRISTSGGSSVRFDD